MQEWDDLKKISKKKKAIFNGFSKSENELFVENSPQSRYYDKPHNNNGHICMCTNKNCSDYKYPNHFEISNQDELPLTYKKYKTDDQDTHYPSTRKKNGPSLIYETFGKPEMMYHKTQDPKSNKTPPRKNKKNLETKPKNKVNKKKREKTEIVIEKIVEVPVEKIVEMTKILEIEKIREIPKYEFEEKILEIPVIHHKEIGREYEVIRTLPKIVQKDVITEKIVDKIKKVEKIVEIPYEVEYIVEIEKPIEKVVEIINKIEKIKEVEQIIEVPKEVEIIEEVEKIVLKEVDSFREVVIERPYTVIRKKYIDVIKEVEVRQSSKSLRRPDDFIDKCIGNNDQKNEICTQTEIKYMLPEPSPGGLVPVDDYQKLADIFQANFDQAGYETNRFVRIEDDPNELTDFFHAKLMNNSFFAELSVPNDRISNLLSSQMNSNILNSKRGSNRDLLTVSPTKNINLSYVPEDIGIGNSHLYAPSPYLS